MTQTTYIYTLVDPRDQTHRYIGKTVQHPPQKRLRQHLLKPATEDLANWFEELAVLDLKPEFRILESVPPDADWRATEIYWIRYGLAHDWYLKNRASGGDNYPLDLLLNAKSDDIIPRTIYAGEDTLRLLTTINCYVMRGKPAEDDTFRLLLHQALLIVQAKNTQQFDDMEQDFHNHILTSGMIQIGRGWRIPIIKKQNPLGGEFFAVKRPFSLNGISIPGKWDKLGWRVAIKMHKRTSELLDTLATVMINERRQGYENTLQQALEIIETGFDTIVRM